jgi:hypothetical protein
MNAIDRFVAAVEARDLAAFDGLFAPEARLFSPVKYSPFEGASAIRALLEVLLRTFEDFRYEARMAGEPLHGLVFRAKIGDKQIHGIDLIRLDDEGLIDEITVMVRPLSAVTALGEAVLAGFAAGEGRRA